MRSLILSLLFIGLFACSKTEKYPLTFSGIINPKIHKYLNLVKIPSGGENDRMFYEFVELIIPDSNGYFSIGLEDTSMASYLLIQRDGYMISRSTPFLTSGEYYIDLKKKPRYIFNRDRNFYKIIEGDTNVFKKPIVFPVDEFRESYFNNYKIENKQRDSEEYMERESNFFEELEVYGKKNDPINNYGDFSRWRHLYLFMRGHSPKYSKHYATLESYDSILNEFFIPYKLDIYNTNKTCRHCYQQQNINDYD